MVAPTNACGTWAVNGINNLVESDSFFKRQVQSRPAALFTAVPLAVDVLANVALAAVNLVLAPITKVLELAAAFFGSMKSFGEFANDAANCLGKAVGGLVAIALTATVGTVLYPYATVAFCRALGLAATTPAPSNADDVVNDILDDLEEQEQQKTVKQQGAVESVKGFFSRCGEVVAEKAAQRNYQIGAAVTSGVALVVGALGFAWSKGYFAGEKEPTLEEATAEQTLRLAQQAELQGKIPAVYFDAEKALAEAQAAFDAATAALNGTNCTATSTEAACTNLTAAAAQLNVTGEAFALLSNHTADAKNLTENNARLTVLDALIKKLTPAPMPAPATT